jgi:hypothetical protein
MCSVLFGNDPASNIKVVLIRPYVIPDANSGKCSKCQANNIALSHVINSQLVNDRHYTVLIGNNPDLNIKAKLMSSTCNRDSAGIPKRLLIDSTAISKQLRSY